MKMWMEEILTAILLFSLMYLVGANNELMRELKRVESESIGHIAIPNVVADNIVLEENF